MSSKIDPSDSVKEDIETNIDTNITKQQHQQQQQQQQQQQRQSLWTLFVESHDSEKLPEYATFKLKDGRTQMSILICVMHTLFYAFKFVFVTVNDGVPLLLRLTTYCRTIVPILEMVYIYLLKKHVHTDVLTSEGKIIIQIGNITILVQAIATVFMLVSWVITRDDCQSDVCHQDFPEKMIPLGMLLHQIIGGACMPIFFTCHDASACLFSSFLTFAAMIVAAVLLHLRSLDILYMFLFGLVIFFCNANYEITIFSNFMSYSKFESTLRAKVASENEEYLMKIQTEEMRHMIGTCRHIFCIVYLCL
jgi:hypothetical protein